MKRIFKVLSSVVGLLSIGICLLPLAHSDSGKEKVKILHKPGTSAEKELLVPAEALAGHLAHGDKIVDDDGGGDKGR